MARQPDAAARRCRARFLRFFQGGCSDETYRDWERDYKSRAHEQWEEALNAREFGRLPGGGRYADIARWAVRVEQRSFERWCDAVAELPRRQTRVLTWPLVTVFGFLAQPE